MNIFFLTFSQMLMMFVLILLGYILRKINILPENSDKTLSRLETYIFVPALTSYHQIMNCTPQTFRENSQLILYGGIVVAIMILLSYPLSKLFVRNPQCEYKRNIYKYAITFGNYGFFGNYIVLGIWGSEALFKYQMFTLVIGILCYSWGLYILIPKNKNGKSIFKNFVDGFKTPPMIAVVAGILLGLFNAKELLPQFILNTLSNASGCMGPVAMILAGFVIGGYKINGLFMDLKIYIVAFLRLILIPAVIVMFLKISGATQEIITFALIAFAAPLGLNTIVFPATYGGDAKTGASMAVISHIMSVITLPLMYYLFLGI